jgi:hypothetical protein
MAEKVGMPMKESAAHPMPQSDSAFMKDSERVLGGYVKIPETLRYAFISEAQLKRWMYNDKWLPLVERLGFMLYQKICNNGHYTSSFS